jgi:hypothetical protein
VARRCPALAPGAVEQASNRRIAAHGDGTDDKSQVIKSRTMKSKVAATASAMLAQAKSCHGPAAAWGRLVSRTLGSAAVVGRMVGLRIGRA